MSNQPPPYSRQFNFEDYQTLNPTAPLPGEKVEAELNGARSSINQTISRLNEIQNADGSLKTPAALAAETTATATAVATAVAGSATQAYLSANYDPNVAIDAAASAAAALASKTEAQTAEFLALTHSNYAEQATLSAQNYAGQAATARAQAQNHASAANTSKLETAALALAVEADFDEVSAVYAASLSLKNWVDSESFQFLHKREDMSDAGAIMMFNDGEAENTLIGKVFQGASVSPDSSVVYRPPTSGTSVGNMDIYSGPWWVEGHDSPEDPHKIVMRDMMSCLVDTWTVFGPRVGPWSGGVGNIKLRQNGINGQPQAQFHEGPERIKGVNYSKDNFGVGILQGSQPLTPKGYVDDADTALSVRIDGKANVTHTHSVSDVTGLQAMIDASKLQDYDNFKIYTTNDLVLSNNKIFKFNNFVGAAGYGPITHPTYWTEQSAQPDLTPYLTSANAAATYAITSRGIPTGGTTGQVLKKTSSSNYAVSWQPDTDTNTGVWGSISGNITSQTDLNTALNSKAALSHTHTIANITGLQSELDGKVSALNTVFSGLITIPDLKTNDLINYESQSSDNPEIVSTSNITFNEGSFSWPITGVQRGIVISGKSYTSNQPLVGAYVNKPYTLSTDETASINPTYSALSKLKYRYEDASETTYPGNYEQYRSFFSFAPNAFDVGTRYRRNAGQYLTGEQEELYRSGVKWTGIPDGYAVGSGGGELEIKFPNFGAFKFHGLLGGAPCLRYPDSTLQYTAFIPSQYIPKTGGTFTGKVTFNPESTIVPINIGHSSAPASSIAGDLWLGTNTVSYKDATNAVRTLSVNGLSNVFSAPQTIDTTATTPALRVTQKGTGNVLLCEDATNPDTTALVVDGAGNVGVGVATGYSATAKLEVVGNTKSTTFSSGTGPIFKVNAVQSHSGGSDTHELLMSVNGSTYSIGMKFVSTP
jgi:hypothetical protein